jgi:phenylacetate-CoA ligase
VFCDRSPTPMSKTIATSYIRDEVEAAAREEIESLQLQRLRAGVDRISKCVPFYRDRLGAGRVSADSIRSLDDLAQFPCTTKSDLRDNYPFGLLAVPMSDVIRIHASSGTTGKPTVVAYTRAEIGMWSELMARSY